MEGSTNHHLYNAMLPSPPSHYKTMSHDIDHEAGPLNHAQDMSMVSIASDDRVLSDATELFKNLQHSLPTAPSPAPKLATGDLDFSLFDEYSPATKLDRHLPLFPHLTSSAD